MIPSFLHWSIVNYLTQFDQNFAFAISIFLVLKRLLQISKLDAIRPWTKWLK